MSVIVMLLVVWAAIDALYTFLDMSIWIAIVLGAFTLPALWDVIRDTCVSVQVWDGRIAWHATFSEGDTTDIDHVRLNRRFDGSMKVTLVHLGGATTRLPPDITPPVEPFEAALKEAGIPSQRHPFLPF